MKNIAGGVLATLLIALITLPAGPAAAKTEVAVFKLRDKSLLANFEGASDDFCFVSQTSITFDETITQTSGPRVVAPSTEVEIFYANNCTGEFLHFLGGTAQQTVRVAADLSSATLVAVVPVVSDDGAGANVTVNVTWTANAPTSKAERTTRSRSGDTLLLEHAVFEARAADVSGTLATVLPLAAGPTFVDLGRLPEGGQLGAGLDGTRTVTFSDGHP